MDEAGCGDPYMMGGEPESLWVLAGSGTGGGKYVGPFGPLVPKALWLATVCPIDVISPTGTGSRNFTGSLGITFVCVEEIPGTLSS